MSVTFPRHVYFRGGDFLICRDEASYAAALEVGGSDDPPPADAFTLITEMPVPEKKPRGRPRKEVA